jgi:hypothetical protein
MKTLRNTVTVTGLNRLAALAVNSAAGVVNALVVGSATAGPALTDSQSSFGEISRKSMIAQSQSREWFFGVATWGGAADRITSVTLNSAGLTIGTSSLATSFIMNRVNGLGVTLGNSDFLNLTTRVRVGSHDVARPTTCSRSAREATPSRRHGRWSASSRSSPPRSRTWCSSRATSTRPWRRP